MGVSAIEDAGGTSMVLWVAVFACDASIRVRGYVPDTHRDCPDQGDFVRVIRSFNLSGSTGFVK